MEKENSSIRDRLLARLPQPENLAAFQKETAALLAKHERALFWEKWTVQVFAFCLAVVCMLIFLLSGSAWGIQTNAGALLRLEFAGFVLFLAVQIYVVRESVYRSHVNLLKEIKQVQLQVLELQASLQKSGDQEL